MSRFFKKLFRLFYHRSLISDMEEKRFSKLEALDGFIKICNCYRSVIKNQDIEEIKRKAQLDSCDRLKESWKASMLFYAGQNLEFYYYVCALDDAIQYIIRDVERRNIV